MMIQTRPLPSAEVFNQRVSVVPYEGVPIEITTARVVSAERPARRGIRGDNIADKQITDISVRVYVYRPNGRVAGFRSVQERQTLEPGHTRGSIVHMSELTIQPESVVVIGAVMVTFEDGSRWREPSDMATRVRAEVARVQVR